MFDTVWKVFTLSGCDALCCRASVLFVRYDSGRKWGWHLWVRCSGTSTSAHMVMLRG